MLPVPRILVFCFKHIFAGGLDSIGFFRNQKLCNFPVASHKGSSNIIPRKPRLTAASTAPRRCLPSTRWRFETVDIRRSAWDRAGHDGGRLRTPSSEWPGHFPNRGRQHYLGRRVQPCHPATHGQRPRRHTRQKHQQWGTAPDSPPGFIVWPWCGQQTR